MTWADLLQGDVLLNSEDFPIIVVLSCVPSENFFSWMHLTGDSAGRSVSADLKVVNMWEEPILKTYKAILRGAERIET